MRRTRIHLLTVLLSPIIFVPNALPAEIYKWVDADGKVHFGDKPHDPTQAPDAKPIELKESYQPSVRTADEQKTYDDEQRHIQLRDQMRRRDETKAQEEADAKRHKEKEELCANYAKDIEGLSKLEIKNGVRTFYYAKENGKPVSSDRQREIIEELKKKSADAGCT